MADPVRTCVGCRERTAASALLRIASIGSAEPLVIDRRHRLGGRGAWLHPSEECLEIAVRRRAFGRALRRTVGPEHTADLTRQFREIGTGASTTGSGWLQRGPVL